MPIKKDREILPSHIPLDGELIPQVDDSNASAYEQGYMAGLRHGLLIGLEELKRGLVQSIPVLIRDEIARTPTVKAGLSEGLRCGSSKSGKALVEVYRYGKLNDQDQLN